VKTIALLATLNRPERLTKTLRSLADTAPALPVMVATDPDDEAAREIARIFGAACCQTDEPRRGPAYAWNTALAHAPDFDAYVLAADDLIFLPGWYEAALKELSVLGGSGLVGFNDGRKRPELPATHYLMTRDFITRYNGGVMCCPRYRTWGVDVEAVERARRAGCYAYAKDAKVTHEWTAFSDPDETYLQARPYYAADKRTLALRQIAGWPDDFEPVLRGGERCAG
jgi:glycosyltransferase involved in cell wall biosynthesis